eukprot:scaffold55220_cov19-Prasinocladus_malaysianus.AAC.3
MTPRPSLSVELLLPTSLSCNTCPTLLLTPLFTALPHYSASLLLRHSRYYHICTPPATASSHTTRSMLSYVAVSLTRLMRLITARVWESAAVKGSHCTYRKDAVLCLRSTNHASHRLPCAGMAAGDSQAAQPHGLMVPTTGRIPIHRASPPRHQQRGA